MLRRINFIIIIVFCLPFLLQAQKSFNPDSIAKSKIYWDTNYYRKYAERFIVAVFQSERRYNIEFDPLFASDSGKASLNYYADANKVSGMEIDFDKISISFGIKSTPPDNVALKGKTTYSYFGFSLGGNKWFLESSYRKYKGFYDIKTANYDTSYKSGRPYTQNPSMLNEAVKFKFLYFTNHKKFAYKSAYTCVYRQLKSSASWVLSSNLYYNSIRTDSSFVPKQIRYHYDSYADLNGMRMLGLSGGAGASINVVIWKALFFNLTGIGNVESQWRKSSYNTGYHNDLNYLTLSFDFRGSIGINNKNFFMTVSSTNDINIFSSKSLGMVSNFYSGNFTIGYRFKVKPPTWYRKLQATKLYNMI